jgi:ankyrin repeat protein
MGYKSEQKYNQNFRLISFEKFDCIFCSDSYKSFGKFDQMSASEARFEFAEHVLFFMDRNSFDHSNLIDFACKVGDLKLLKYLHEIRGIPLDDENSCGNALRTACSRGHLPVVQYLVENNMDVNILSDSPIVMACHHGHLEIVKYLLSHGADLHGNDDQLAITASCSGHLDIVQFLIESGVDFVPPK